MIDFAFPSKCLRMLSSSKVSFGNPSLCICCVSCIWTLLLQSSFWLWCQQAWRSSISKECYYWFQHHGFEAKFNSHCLCVELFFFSFLLFATISFFHFWMFLDISHRIILVALVVILAIVTCSLHKVLFNWIVLCYSLLFFVDFGVWVCQVTRDLLRVLSLYCRIWSIVVFINWKCCRIFTHALWFVFFIYALPSSTIMCIDSELFILRYESHWTIVTSFLFWLLTVVLSVLKIFCHNIVYQRYWYWLITHNSARLLSYHSGWVCMKAFATPGRTHVLSST